MIKDTCPECNGTGTVPGAGGEEQWTCSECDGTGEIEIEEDE